MTQALKGGVEALRASMAGTVVTPEDVEFEQARKVWNAGIDHRPAVVARCISAQDVSDAVLFAQATGLELAVRCGAHSIPGYSSTDGGLVVDVGQMNQVAVDPEGKRARVQGGALLRDLDAATQGFGLAVPAGLVSHTGVSGLTLGGGMGWLTRQAGLSIDNMISAEVVIADGTILRAAEDENIDLFWAIRGGGGNFGVVTELEFRLHDVNRRVVPFVVRQAVALDEVVADVVAVGVLPVLLPHVGVTDGHGVDMGGPAASVLARYPQPGRESDLT